MPSIYDLKPRFQALLRPLLSLLAQTGVTANHVTVAAMVFSVFVERDVVMERRSARLHASAR